MSAYYFFETKKGHIAVSWQGNLISGLALPFSHVGNLKSWINQNWKNHIYTPSLPEDIKNIGKELMAYFEGIEIDFEQYQLATQNMTPFQKSVYRSLRTVKRGETITYGQLGELVGKPGSARAVGSCMSRNPIQLLIPCHRVLLSSNKIGKFSAEGGAHMKKWMLDIEKPQNGHLNG